MSQSRGEVEGKNTIELNTTVILKSMCMYILGGQRDSSVGKSTFLDLDPRTHIKAGRARHRAKHLQFQHLGSRSRQI